MRLLPSIASANVLQIGEEIGRLGDWPDLHFDIEDGNFTPNITFGQKMMKNVSRAIAPRQLDVHMMAMRPLELLPALKEANVKSACAHLEALRFPLQFLNGVRQAGMKAGLALNFATPLEAVQPFLPQIDYLLVMTSEPDNAGEPLNTLAFHKALKAAESLPVPVYADGALGENEVLALHKAGAAGCVLGRLVFGSPDPALTLRHLAEQMAAHTA